MSNKHTSISWREQWILLGILLKYSLYRHSEHKKWYYFVSPEGQWKEKYNVHKSVIKKLKAKNLITESVRFQDGKHITKVGLSTSGFDLIYDTIGKLAKETK